MFTTSPEVDAGYTLKEDFYALFHQSLDKNGG